MSNAVVYIDYENVHKIFAEYKENAQSTNLIQKIWEYCERNTLTILDIYIYCNFDNPELHESFHQTWLQQYDVEVRHTSNNGKNYADLQIAVDVLEQVYRNDNTDAIILLSSDRDMVPLVKAIRRNNKIVHWITTVQDCAPGMDIFPDHHELLENLLEIRDQAGNPIEATIKTPKDIVYDCVNEYVNKRERQSNPASPTPTLISIEYMLKNLLVRTRFLRIEILRNLRTLEGEGKIIAYEYTYSTRTYVGIITDSKTTEYSTAILQYNALTGYFTERKIEELLAKNLY